MNGCLKSGTLIAFSTKKASGEKPGLGMIIDLNRVEKTDSAENPENVLYYDVDCGDGETRVVSEKSIIPNVRIDKDSFEEIVATSKAETMALKTFS